jgi:hypothetical protein
MFCISSHAPLCLCWVPWYGGVGKGRPAEACAKAREAHGLLGEAGGSERWLEEVRGDEVVDRRQAWGEEKDERRRRSLVVVVMVVAGDEDDDGGGGGGELITTIRTRLPVVVG